MATTAYSRQIAFVRAQAAHPTVATARAFRIGGYFGECPRDTLDDPYRFGMWLYQKDCMECRDDAPYTVSFVHDRRSERCVSADGKPYVLISFKYADEPERVVFILLTYRKKQDS